MSRLGYGKNGAENIKRHPFFNSIDWHDINMKRVVPEFVPQLKEGDVSSNFAAAFTSLPVEDSLVAASALTESREGRFDDFEYVAKNHRLSAATNTQANAQV